MFDKFSNFKNYSNLNIPESFDNRFENTLKCLPEKKKSIKYSYKKIACISSILLISTGVAFGLSNNIYKYLPTKGVVLESDQDIYILKDKINKKDLHNNNLAFDMFIDNATNNAVVNIFGEFYTPTSNKSTLQIGDKVYSNSRTSSNELENTWGVVDSFENIKYSPGDKVIYTIYLTNYDKITFDANLESAKGASNYKDLGITSNYNNIPITTMITEKENTLTASFVSDLKNQNLSLSYGDRTGRREFSGVELVDANGKMVYGLREVTGGLVDADKIHFDTTGLVKPYKIILSQIVVGFDIEDNELPKSDNVTLNIPKEDGAFDIDMNVPVDISTKKINTQNCNIKILKGYRSDDKVFVEVDYPKNSFSQIIASKNNFFSKDELVNNDYIVDENGTNRNVLEFNISDFSKTLDFSLSPVSYNLLGDWEFIVK